MRGAVAIAMMVTMTGCQFDGSGSSSVEDGGADDGGADDGGADDAGNVVMAWWDTDWQSRIRITFDNAAGAENLTNFPVLVALSASDIDYARTSSAGSDLRFVDDDGSTVLSHEVELWDEAGVSYLWVRVPQIDAGSTTDHIWLYFENAAAPSIEDAASVWTNGYVGVWHLSETPSNNGAFADSTGNNLDGTYRDSDGDSDTSAAGMIGGAVELSGDTDGIDIADNAALQITGSMTISGWIRPDIFRNRWPRILNKHGPVANGAYRLEVSDQLKVGQIGLSTNGDNRPVRRGATILAEAELVQLVGVFDASAQTLDLYLNGGLDNGALLGTVLATQHSDNGRAVVLGDSGAGGLDADSVDGLIDEVRIANTARSAAWVAAQYRSATQTFASFGLREDGP